MTDTLLADNTPTTVTPRLNPSEPEAFDHLPDHVIRQIRSVIDDDAVVEGLKGFENLRDYQREAVLVTAARVKKTKEPLLITLPTGAGKSWVIAALASVVKAMTAANTGKTKKILVLAHSKELVAQNAAKMEEAGYHATIYASGLKQRDASGDIVFGSRQTVINAVGEFAEMDYEFSAVFIDEAHSVPRQTREILDALREINPNLRVIGLTATPYSLGNGYIYAQDTFRNLPPLREVHTRAPFFAELVYDTPAHLLIEQGFLTPPVLGSISDAYDTRGLERSVGGTFTEASSNAVFVDGQTNLTKRIVAEVLEKAKERNGVMLFAQNREHARQILSFLPAKESALVDSGTKDKERDDIIQKFKDRKLKYLTTVSALATGFDAPGVDLIAVLRSTESQALFQQIIGRGLRLCPEIGKRDCLVLDYAQNQSADGDLFTPVIELGVPTDTGGGAPMIEVTCPKCQGENTFRKARWPQDTEMNDNGFLFHSETRKLLLSGDKKPIAGHLGVQCNELIEQPGTDRLTRCDYTWGAIVCPRCQRLNSHRQDFCQACEQPLSKRARRMTITASRDQSYTHRLVRVVNNPKIWLYPGKSASAGNPTLRVSLQVQELPYLTPADPPKRGRKSREEQESDDAQPDWLPPGYLLVRPEPFKLVAWLNPTVRHAAAQASWNALKEYACINEWTARKWDSYGSVEPLMEALASPNSNFYLKRPNYLVYQARVVGKPESEGGEGTRTFYNLISFHRQHPNAEEVDTPLPRKDT